MNWYLKVVRDNYANFTGRARREELWMFVLFNFLISLGISIVLGGLAYVADMPMLIMLSYVYSLAIMIPAIAVSVRRLHDIGKSGWFLLLVLIPLIGPILILVWHCTDSEPGPNQWGDNPKGIGNDRKINEIGKE